MQIRKVSIALCLFSLFSLSGCWSYRASTAHLAVARTPAPDLSTWPSRDIDPLKPILENTPEQIERYGVLESVDRESLSPLEKQLLEVSKTTVYYKGIHGRSLLRIFSWIPQPRISLSSSRTDRLTELLGPGFPSNARTISSRTLDAMEDSRVKAALLSIPEPNRPALPITLSPASKRSQEMLPRVLPTFSDEGIFIESGKPIHIPPIKNPGEYKGLILHFQAIAYNEYEPRVLEEFERRGWAIIDISTESSTQPPLPDSQIALYKEAKGREHAILNQIYAQQVAAFPASSAPPESDNAARLKWIDRFYSYERKHPLYSRYLKALSETAKLRAGSFQACAGADLDAVALQLAQRADQAIAGNAYAAETCLDYALTQRPDLQNIPVVMIGFSAGALTTPTAAALLRDQLDAVVIIGGAANIFMVTQQSTFTDGGLRVRCGTEKVPPATIKEIAKRYLEHSKLDPFHTAPMIAHLPILQVHASMDTWVPAALGEILYQRLGNPDRLTIAAGHELLFYFLPEKSSFIADWVEKTTANRASLHPASSSPPRARAEK